MRLHIDSLGQLVGLSCAGSLSKYMQETSDQRYELIEQDAVISTGWARWGHYQITGQLNAP